MTISEHCCLHCDGTVYKSDTVIETIVEEDLCGTIKSSVCKKNDKGSKNMLWKIFKEYGYNEVFLGLADVAIDFSYKSCCNDDEGKTLHK